MSASIGAYYRTFAFRANKPFSLIPGESRISCPEALSFLSLALAGYSKSLL